MLKVLPIQYYKEVWTEADKPSLEDAKIKKLVYEMLAKILRVSFYSQATQDVFVTKMLSNKKNGTYIEIGGGHPQDSNNTFLLEKEFFWRGVSLEFDADLVCSYNVTRVNKAINADATNFDWKTYLKRTNSLKQIDYLSIDIEPAKQTFEALKNLPHDEYRFSVITFEHDRYKSGEKYMQESRSFLKKLGYKLVVSNVLVFGRDFEDWWVDPRVVSKHIWEIYKSQNIEFAKIWIR